MPASLLWLLAAWKRPTRGLQRAPTVLALIVALTVAQPFGVIASSADGAFRPTPPAEPPNPREPPQTNGDDVHVARVFGIPLLPFRLYNRGIFWSGENTPTSTLRARSWFWLPALTHATQIAETCSSDVLTPCWAPEPGAGYPPTQLTVARDGDKHLVTLDNPPGRGTDAVPDSFSWQLRAGIASPAGLVYWALATVLVITARRRPGPNASHSAGPPTSTP